MFSGKPLSHECILLHIKIFRTAIKKLYLEKLEEILSYLKQPFF